MTNAPPYITFLEQQLNHISSITFKPIFSWHSIYVQDEVVGTVNNNKLYIKNMRASENLAKTCELKPAFESATHSYYVTDDLIEQLDLKKIFEDIAVETKSKEKK